MRICRVWVDYWRKLTGDRIAYRPYQEAAADFPAIPADEFRRAMQLIEPAPLQQNWRAYAGAAASFRLLTHAPGHGLWWWLYSYVPGCARLSEAAYSFLSRRRGLLATLTSLLWGIPLEPDRTDLVSWLFLRGLGAIYVAAFASLGVQILGLVGSGGLLPLGEYLAAAHEGWGTAAYWRLPTLFWLGTSDTLLVAGTIAGVALGALVVANVMTRAALVALFALYLSYVYAGQLFLSYQWDMLLRRDGLPRDLPHRRLAHRRLALPLPAVPLPVPRRRGETALGRPDVDLADGARLSLLDAAAARAARLVRGAASAFGARGRDRRDARHRARRRVPHLFAAPPANARRASGAGVPGRDRCDRQLQLVQPADDAAVPVPVRRRGRCGACCRQASPGAPRRRAPHPGRTATAIAAVLALVTVPVGVNLLWVPFAGRNLPVAGAMTEALAPLLIVNPYGLFATTTTARPEIVIEGSDDGRAWREYEFRYKPGPIRQPLTWNIPHQPRLDWQMWFAAYGSAGDNRWIERLLERLLQGSKPVLALLGANPFPEHPPKYVRAQRYAYRFADAGRPEERGQWWVRTLDGMYFPQASLEDFQRAPGP